MTERFFMTEEEFELVIGKPAKVTKSLEEALADVKLEWIEE